MADRGNKRRNAWAPHAATGIALVAVSLILAEVSGATAGMLGGLRFPAEYRSWSIEQESDTTDVTQLYVPFVGALRFGPQVDFVLAGAYGSSARSPASGEEFTLAGPSDVTAQLFARLGGDRVLLQAGLGLPSGTKELDNEQLSVAQALSHPLLGYRLKTYGQGLDLSAGAATAFPLGGSGAFGLGIGLVSHGAYTLVEDGDDYKPGLETSFSAGFDLGGIASGKGAASGGGSPLRVDLSYRTYGKDELDGTEIFQEGAQIEGQVTVAAGRQGPHFEASLRAVAKSDNTVFQGSGETVEELKDKPGTSLRADTHLDFPVGGQARLGVAAELHRFSGADVPALNGTTFGVGPSLALFLSPRASISLGGQLLGGSIDEDEESGLDQVDLSGFAALFGFTWRAQ